MKKFIEKAKKKHGDKYNYSLVDYLDCYTEIEIICKTHDIKITTTPTYHLKNNGYDCKECLKIFQLNFKKKNTNEFVENSIKIHGDKYDYSLVEYKTSKDKVKIICKIHGIFEQNPNNHLQGKECYDCGLNKNKAKSSLNEFVENSIKIHGDKYDYSLVEYKTSKDKVKIICKIHDIFEQLPDNHLQGSGCVLCSGTYLSNTNEFIEKAKQIHGDKYDYSLVNYIQANSKIEIICKIHGKFEQTPSKHTNGKQGCIKCTGKSKLTFSEFMNKCNSMHGNKYDYSLVDYNNCDTKIKIICKKCGIFEQTPYEHYNGHNCPYCVNSNYSKQSIKYLDFISKYNGINIIHAENGNEYRIQGQRIKVDGYCKETNTIYEYHGDFWHGNPKLFNSNKINAKNTKTFGELYQKTLEREQLIRDLGYNLVVMWEYDWKRLNILIKILQRKFRSNR